MMRRWLSSVLLLALFVPAAFAQKKQESGDSDPVLQAMRTEMERSKAKLKLEEMAAPYYIDYRVTDLQDTVAEAAFGAMRSEVHARIRFLRVTVRVGDYKQDSFYREGVGSTEFMPLDDDLIALRHQIWLGTDQAYKTATRALAEKQAALKQFNVEQPVDDFAHADPVQSIEALARLDVDPQLWYGMLKKASAVYKSDPQLEAIDARLQFQATNKYFVNSEGTVTRNGETAYQLTLALRTQAADGMRLDRSHEYAAPNSKELPSEQEFVKKAGELLSTLKQLRDAPIADDEYRGPVLFSGDAASTVFADFVGENVLGTKPQLGTPARTRGAWATSYKSRVLPDFMNVVDDPTVGSMAGQSLLGHYDVDDEGVKASKVDLVEDGKLMNYVIGREPIRDFPTSNGHGRAANPAIPPGPSLGNLIVRSAQPLSPAELKQKLIDICKQRELPYGYYVETLGPGRVPRLIYKVDAKDGHEELVRGAIFGDLDARAVRNDLVAAGNDVYVDNRMQNIPHSIVSPSVLFDELEVKRANAGKQKLPEYPPPPIAAK